jgi:AGZA family xanthine/uracil permease-like MFS transporter
MLIGSQAFQESPKQHAPAIVLSLMPHLAAWGKNQIDNALAAAGTSATAVGLDKLGKTGVLYEGLTVLGNGAILGGLVLGAIAAFVIDRAFAKAAAFALAGAALTFFGFMHSEAIGVGKMPALAASYLAISALLAVCTKLATSAAISHAEAEQEHEHGSLVQPAE